ncbi:MAG: TIR domain-containing protein [Bryobacteraceae bacterium]|jgi:hypothetical protein
MRLFVASSMAGLPEARAIQECLETFAEVVIWNQQVFTVSSYALESLERASAEFDFGIFVMTPDDLQKKDRKRIMVPRDNVILEFGIFFGSLGRHRSFLVVPSSARTMHLPSDLDGLVYARYQRDRADGNLTAALSPACEKIRRAIEIAASEPDHGAQDLSPTPLGSEPSAHIRNKGNEPGSAIHHYGRLPSSYTGKFLTGAREEITVIGTSLNSFIGYFDSRPEAEIKIPVINALNHGVKVQILFLDPDCSAAKRWAEDRSDHRCLAEIKRTLNRARELRAELLQSGKAAKLDIRIYQQYPAFQLKRVDGTTTSGRILFYPYLPGINRPETPYIEIRSRMNPRLYGAYSRACDHLLKISRACPK